MVVQLMADVSPLFSTLVVMPELIIACQLPPPEVANLVCLWRQET